MAIPLELTLEQFRSRITATLAQHWKLLLVEGIVLEVLGVAAFSLPYFSTLAIDILVGWLIFLGGVVRVVTLLRARHVPGYGWSLAAGLLAIGLGILLAINPFRGELTLTMVLTVLFFVEGISAIAAGLDFRHHARNWGWLLFSGIANLVLVFLIWYGWPGTAAWAIGVLAGVNLFLIGLSVVMMAFAVRQQA
jgi:uncharacterized membrane protein HdeD (DUF308 family)